METYIFTKNNLPNEAKIAMTKEDGDGVKFIKDLTKHHEVGKIDFTFPQFCFCNWHFLFNILYKEIVNWKNANDFNAIVVGIVGAFFFFASLFFYYHVSLLEEKNKIKNRQPTAN